MIYLAQEGSVKEIWLYRLIRNAVLSKSEAISCIISEKMDDSREKNRCLFNAKTQTIRFDMEQTKLKYIAWQMCRAKENVGCHLFSLFFLYFPT